MSYKIPVVGTEIRINDFSEIKEQPALVSTVPLYLTAFSSDKGPEELIEVSGDKFFELYGDRETISYKKHGQPLLQAATAIDAGARLLCKRVVAPDATLANLTVFAEVKVEPRLVVKTKTDSTGRLRLVFEDPNKPSSDDNEFFWDEDGKYVPKRISDPKGRKSVLIRYFTKSDKNIKNIKEIKDKYLSLYGMGSYGKLSGVYPLFTISDIGRGKSSKSIRIEPTFYGRNITQYQKHTISVIENDKIVESADFIFHPDIIINGANNGLNTVANTYMNKVNIYQYEDSVLDLYDFVAENTVDEGVSVKDHIDYLKTIDFIFGKDRRNYVEYIQVVPSADSILNEKFDANLDGSSSSTTEGGTETDNTGSTSTETGTQTEGGTNFPGGDYGTETGTQTEGGTSTDAGTQTDEVESEELKKIKEQLKKVNEELLAEKEKAVLKDAENEEAINKAKAKIAELEKKQAEAIKKAKEEEERRRKTNRDSLGKTIEQADLFKKGDSYTKHKKDDTIEGFDKAYARAVSIFADTMSPYSADLLAYVNNELLSHMAGVDTTYVPASEPPKTEKNPSEEEKAKKANLAELNQTLQEAEVFKTTEAYTNAEEGPVLDAFEDAFLHAVDMNNESKGSKEIKAANDDLKLKMAALASYKKVEPQATEEELQAFKSNIDAANQVIGSVDYTGSDELPEKVAFEKALKDAIVVRDGSDHTKKTIAAANAELLEKTEAVKLASKKNVEEKKAAEEKAAELKRQQEELEKKKKEEEAKAKENQENGEGSSTVHEEAGGADAGHHTEEGTEDHSTEGPGVVPAGMVLADLGAAANLDPVNNNAPKRNVINLMTANGNSLENGDNGCFGEAPFGKFEYEDELFKFFNGDTTNQIYDHDNYKIDMIIDANYPRKVKLAIEEYIIKHRDDCIYLRDYGLGMNSMQDILQTQLGFAPHYRCADYYLSYDIIDPYSNRQVPVTMTYTLAKMFVNHFKNGRHRPCAGMSEFTITDAIPGTESFIPTVTKFGDNKETLTDARINYAKYYDSKLVIETLFTSQEKYSQLSFINNVLNIQRLVKLIRTKCPTIRYAFLDGKELQDYKQEIESTLGQEKPNFRRLEVKFKMDRTNVTNKQIYVVVEVTCRDFEQSELFDINIINIDQALEEKLGIL